MNKSLQPLLLHPLSAPLAKSAPWLRPGDFILIPRRDGGAHLLSPTTLSEFYDAIVEASPYPDYASWEASMFSIERCNRVQPRTCDVCRRHSPHPPCYLHEEREPGHGHPTWLPGILVPREHIGSRLRLWRKTLKRSLTEVAQAYVDMPIVEQQLPRDKSSTTPNTMRSAITLLESGQHGYRHPGYVMGLGTLYRRPLADLVVAHTTLADFVLRTDHHGAKEKPGSIDYSGVPKDLLMPDLDPIKGVDISVRTRLTQNLALFRESLYRDFLRARDEGRKVGYVKGARYMTPGDVEQLKRHAREELIEQLRAEGRLLDSPQSSTTQPEPKEEDTPEAAPPSFSTTPNVAPDFELDDAEAADMLGQDPRFK